MGKSILNKVTLVLSMHVAACSGQKLGFYRHGPGDTSSAIKPRSTFNNDMQMIIHSIFS